MKAKHSLAPAPGRSFRRGPGRSGSLRTPGAARRGGRRAGPANAPRGRALLSLLALLALGPASCGPTPGSAAEACAVQRPSIPAAGIQAALPQAPQAARVPLAATPSLQLEAARAAAARLRQLDPRARLQARLALVEAWRAAAAHPAASDGQRAQALIGAGEHLSALGFHAEAKAAFEDAASLSEDPLVSAGAWLEAAHNARRAGDPHAALGRYERAALAAQGLGSLHSIAGAARLWAARVELERGAFASAAQRFEALADSHCDPLLRLSAFDELALLALAQGDPEGAAGWIQAARLGLAGPAASDTDTGRRLRRALAHLRALPELTLAIEERVRGASHAAPHSGADSQLRLLIDSED